MAGVNIAGRTRCAGVVSFAVAALCQSTTAFAHNPLTSSGQDRAAGLLSALLLLGFWILYVRGCLRVSPARSRALLFHGIFFLCAVTVLGPLDDLAATSTAAHMTQHMLMIVVIAPLWVMSRPLPQISAGGGRAGALLWRPALRLARYPVYAAYLHGAVIWFWHLPWFYMVAVNNPWWHSVEHASFLLTAGIFWWAILRASAARFPAAIVALLFTLMHTGFLGALLSLSQVQFYGEARGLADQQLAGLIMWVAGAVPYFLGLGVLLYHWYNRRLA